MIYTKDNPRLEVQYIDSDTEDIIFRIKDRTWINVGDLLTAHAVSNIMQNEFKGDTIPENLLVLVVSEFKLSQ